MHATGNASQVFYLHLPTGLTLLSHSMEMRKTEG